MGRYSAAAHDTAQVCPNCDTKNAPADSPEADANCWRCDKPLQPDKPCVGDTRTVDIVDIDENGRSVGKTPEGFVLFINHQISAPSVEVTVTEVHETYGTARIDD